MNKQWMRKGLVACAIAGGLATAVHAHAESFLDNFFNSKPDLGSASQRSWRIAQFTTVKLVDKEPHAANNLHPAAVDAAALRTQLGAIQVAVRDGIEPLLVDEELAEIIPVVVRALSLAKPGDDVLLLSHARRGGRMAVPTAVTARLFVNAEGFNVVVNDARLSFIGDYVNTHVEPKFVYGSRTHPSAASLKSASAVSKRGDWVVIPVASLVAAGPALAQPARPAPVAVAATPAPVGVVATPAVPAAPGSPAAVGDEIEQRLVTLKRLRDKNLISEEEYQQKRKEILQRL